ncbi:MAG: hypothetical protein FWG34_00485 [Oscillospiraceae bacterium]|nr:hypothetical protein [Oscillospiraceae bacterium]
MKKIAIISGAAAIFLLALMVLGAGKNEKADEYAEKYLHDGNIFFRAGDAAEEEDQKMQHYAQALRIYQEGITKFPQDVPLKYNYELLLEKIEMTAQESQEQNQEDGDGDSSEGEDAQTKEQDSGDGQEDQAQEGEEGGESEENREEGEDGQNESELDEEAIERILQMLENQEEESLKNNQEIVGGGDENGW